MRLCILSFIFFFLAISPVKAQERVYVTDGNGYLYIVDLLECTRYTIGNTGHGFGDIAITPGRRLYGIEGGELYEIDPFTAQSVLVGNTGVPAVTLVALNDSLLLCESQEMLYSVRTFDGQATFIGQVGYQASGDISLVNNDLYMLTPLVKIQLDPTFSSITSVTPVNLGIPACEGVVTVSYIDGYPTLIGFNAEDAIEVCLLDGTYEVLCPNVNPGGTPGAACVRTDDYFPLQYSCVLGGNESLETSSILRVVPNPASSKITIETAQRYSDYRLFDLSGRQISSGLLPENGELDIATLQEGFYFFQLGDRFRITTVKFQIQR